MSEISVEDLIGIAKEIKDKELRQKVIEILKHPSLSNPKFRQKPAKLSECPASLNWHHVYEGGLVRHTYAVTKMCIAIAQNFKDIYGYEMDMDSLIAASLVHDIGKLWSMRKDKTWVANEISLDHTVLGTAELYARGFPEKVIHIVASHFGEQGPTPPQTPEAILFHHIDLLNATLNTTKSTDDIIRLILG
ncbi:MAG: HDIG domain-containing protein [Candidatus Aenigmatarchaeota archaeon]